MIAPGRPARLRTPRDWKWGAALLAASCTCNSLAGRGAEIEQYGRELVSLKHLELPGGLPAVELEHLLPSHLFAEPDRVPPRLVCTVDVEGTTLAAGHPGLRVAVSSLGVERIPLARTDRGFAPTGSPLPGLVGVLMALQQRDAARGDGARLAALASDDCPQRPRLAELLASAGPDDPPARWVIRTEVDEVQVTEERVSGHRLASTLRRLGPVYRFTRGLVSE